MITRRRILCRFLALSTISLLPACNADNDNKKLPMKNEIVIDVVLYSYLNKTIFDVFLNQSDIGVAGPFGGGGIITGITIPLGLQSLTWRDAEFGNEFFLKNELLIERSSVPDGSYYMAVHIYPDETAELSFSKRIPERSARGIKIVEEFQKNHGQ